MSVLWNGNWSKEHLYWALTKPQLPDHNSPNLEHFSYPLSCYGNIGTEAEGKLWRNWIWVGFNRFPWILQYPLFKLHLFCGIAIARERPDICGTVPGKGRHTNLSKVWLPLYGIIRSLQTLMYDFCPNSVLTPCLPGTQNERNVNHCFFSTGMLGFPLVCEP